MVDTLSYMKQPGHFANLWIFLVTWQHLQVLTCAPLSECETYVFFPFIGPLSGQYFPVPDVNACNWFVLLFSGIVSKPTACLFTTAHNYSNVCGIQCGSQPCTTDCYPGFFWILKCSSKLTTIIQKCSDSFLKNCKLRLLSSSRSSHFVYPHLTAEKTSAWKKQLSI